MNNNQLIFPNTWNFQHGIHVLGKQTKYAADQNDVMCLTKTVPGLEKGEPAPMLAQMKQNYRMPTNYHAPKSEVMSDVPALPDTEENNYIMKWRDRMGVLSANQTIGITEQKVITDQGLPITIYTPPFADEESLPAVVYYHGGAFIGGSIYITEDFVRLLAQVAHVRVLSLDFHYAPEFKAPTVLDETYHSLTWIAANAERLNIIPEQIFVFGESSGGNIAASVSYLDRLKKTNIVRGQVIAYPIATLNKEQTDHYDVPHQTGAGVGPNGLPTFDDVLKLIQDSYLGNTLSDNDPRVSPLAVPDEIAAQMPASLVIADEFDPLRKQDYAYAKKLSQAGVNTHYIYYEGMAHAFLNSVGIVPQASDFAMQAARWLHANL
ncbi:hypothetical protein IV38_GL001979 [Lactobacillus selangorensis]|uniref:Alpha/beta hydrolase fold-3 domain-containing protein n=1 Tax=Lactobacillus selangorensis TaxID=81857 RepID=A0A0R2FNX7_9LACO|nr:alpha/beta hydrolase [Lactobacillus selangorensis]KRN27764.1 hypothetical protein IV38_GL001979 [Lactobacillus selangorensis]KRN30271.1 hypothetical protein IV40_GL001858 [Lactobacillus selangorensis]